MKDNNDWNDIEVVAPLGDGLFFAICADGDPCVAERSVIDGRVIFHEAWDSSLELNIKFWKPINRPNVEFA